MNRLNVKSMILICILVFSGLFAITLGFMTLNKSSSQSQDNITGNPVGLGVSAYGWSTTYLVSTLATRNALYPAIAVDKAGNVHIVWHDSSRIFPSDYWEGAFSYYNDIFYRMWNATTGAWGGHINSTDLVSGISLYTAMYPSITADGTGNVHIVWEDYSTLYILNSNSHIFYSYWNKSTNTWRGHLNVYDLVTPANHTANCLYPKVAVDSKGNLHFVWSDYNRDLGALSFKYNIFYRCWNATKNGWGPLELISNSTQTSSESPSIAVDSKGNVHVVWDDNTNYYGITGASDYDIFYRFRNATTGIWSGKVNATDLVSSESGSGSQYPSITVDKNQNVHVVWHDHSTIFGATGSYNIFYKCWNATTKVWGGRSHPTDVISYDSTTSAFYPKMVTDDSGNLYVVWQQSPTYHSVSRNTIVFSMWNASKGIWTAPQIISTDGSNDCYAPDIAVDSTGAAHVVWYQYQSGTGIYNIYYRKTITRPPVPTTLAPIYPNPNPDPEVFLNWQDQITTTRYYIYRSNSTISSVAGLTPIAAVSGTSYTDTINQNGTFYYVIVAENSIGNSSISNCQSVIMNLVKNLERISITSNADFTKYASKGNGSATNPWIIEKYNINGINRSCISISGTTDYFIVRNCTVFGETVALF